MLIIEKSVSIDGRNQTFFAEYDSFRMSSPLDNYSLHVGKYQGNLNANNSAFSTWDRDNDKVNGSCALTNEGAWWYGRTCDIQDLNSMLGNVTKLSLVKITMKTKKALRGNTLSCYLFFHFYLIHGESTLKSVFKSQSLALYTQT